MTFFYFIIFSQVLVQAKNNNYEQLKEIEKKLLNNQGSIFRNFEGRKRS
ncbi:MAG: hypothetical protein CM15mP118_0760 [Alphaproteobacteria bacterium]|nr:MAG: hypothetical protein CM15mP118_0760 [Alphaproteobacteria bacterium]